MSRISIIILISLSTMATSVFGQESKFAIEPGLHLNSLFILRDYPIGIGAKADLNYRPFESSFLTLALRAKLTYYNFNNNSAITYDDNGYLNDYNSDPDFTYNALSTQIGFVPKLHYEVSEGTYLFLENDFSFAHINTNIEYNKPSVVKKTVSKNVFIYTPSIGLSAKSSSGIIKVSLGYTFFNFRSILTKNKPANFDRYIGPQDTGLLLGISFDIPIIK